MIDRLPRDVQATIVGLLPDASAVAARLSCTSVRDAAGPAGGLSVRCLLGDDTLPPSSLAQWSTHGAGAPLADSRFLTVAAAARRADLFRLSLSLGAAPCPEALEAAIEFLPLGEAAALLRGAGPSGAAGLVRDCKGGVGAALRHNGAAGGGGGADRDGRLARFEWCVVNGFSWNAFEVCRWAAERGDWRLAIRARRLSGRGFPSWAILANICAAHGHAEASAMLAPPGGGPPITVAAVENGTEHSRHV